MMDVLFLSCGAVSGAYLRWKLSSLGSKPHLATISINTVGSFVLGVTIELARYGIISRRSTIMLGTGFCGSFTTLSTFSFNVVDAIENKRYLEAFTTFAGTNILGFSGVFVGMKITKMLLNKRNKI
jgi:CrcB protein